MMIGISGSMQFSDQQLEVSEQLKKMGFETFVSSFIQRYVGKNHEEIEKLKLEDKYEHDAMMEYWELLKDADALLVLNYDKHGIKNYVGGNAFLEMGFAYVLGLPIYLLNPIPDVPYYGTEIIAMKPVILNGDLKKIK